MNKSKKYIIATITFVLLVIIILIMYRSNNPEEKVVREFLNQYYTIDEIVTTEFVNEDTLKKEKSKYANYLENGCLESFINNRTIFRNKRLSYENKCTLSPKNVELIFKYKYENGVSTYDFNATIVVISGNKEVKTSSASGIIQIKKINDNPMITYVDIPNLKIN